MTPTDIAGWIRVIPAFLILLAILGAAAWLLEETAAGRQLVEDIVDRILR